MNSIILISCFLAYAIAQPTITQLTSGTATTSALAVTATADLAETTLEYFAIQLSPNTQTVTIDFDSDPAGTSECGYLYFYYSVRGIPCGIQWDEESGNMSPCRHGEYGYAYATSTSVTFYAGDSGIYGEYSFEAGATTLYISVGKTYSYYDKVCPFSLTATITNCTTSEVAVYATSTTATCVSVTDQTFPLHTTTVINGQQVHRFPVAQEVGHIRIEINSTEYIYAYGGYNYPVNYAGYGADCSASSYNEGDYYSLGLTCSQPKAGWFYLTLQPYYSSDTGINATVSVTQQVCGAQGGYDCSFYAMNYTTSDSYNRTIRAYNSSQDEVAPFDAYFVNFPAGTLANVNFTVCNGPQYVYFIYRKDGYPDYYSDSYVNDGQYTSLSAFECATIVVRPEDTYVGGRFYVAIQNGNSGFAASYQISKASAVVDTSASQTTGESTTDGSGAAALVAPVMMILALIALLF